MSSDEPFSASVWLESLTGRHVTALVLPRGGDLSQTVLVVSGALGPAIAAAHSPDSHVGYRVGLAGYLSLAHSAVEQARLLTPDGPCSILDEHLEVRIGLDRDSTAG